MSREGPLTTGQAAAGTLVTGAVAAYFFLAARSPEQRFGEGSVVSNYFFGYGATFFCLILLSRFVQLAISHRPRS
jgi:hypothetical protein